MPLPCKAGLQGGQQDKSDQMLQEVARSQSLQLTNLHIALPLRVFKAFANKKHMRQAPARWEDHALTTVMHRMSEKQRGTTAMLAQDAIQHLGCRGFCP